MQTAHNMYRYIIIIIDSYIGSRFGGTCMARNHAQNVDMSNLALPIRAAPPE